MIRLGFSELEMYIDYFNIRTAKTDSHIYFPVSITKITCQTVSKNQIYTGCPRKIDTIKFDYFTIDGEFSTKQFFMELKTDYSATKI